MAQYSILISGCSMEWCNCLETAFTDRVLFDIFLNPDPDLLKEAVSNHNPDVLLWKLGNEDPVPMLHELHVRSPFTLPIVLMDNPNKYNMMELLRSGVRGCLPTRLRPRQIASMVEIILNAGMICVPRLNEDLMDGARKFEQSGLLTSLTKREISVLSLLGRGLSNMEIAENMALSESTIKTHLRAVYRKLNIAKRSEAIVLALESGLLDAYNSDSA